MSPVLVKVIQLFLSLSLLIVLHELGHFIPAKLFKTRVEKFFLFFDVKFALFKKKIGDTVYGIGWLPLGGYVKISGMIDESMDKAQMAEEPKPWEFRSKPAWQRLIIMVGGVTVNLVLGFLIYMMILFFYGRTIVEPETLSNGYAVAEQMEQYGFRNGDKILKANGKPLEDANDINRFLLVRDVKNVDVVHADGTAEVLQIPDSIGDYIFKEGVRLPFTPRFKSTILDSVVAGKPAAKLGIRENDKILSVNDQPITYWDEFNTIVKQNKGKEMQVVYERGAVRDTVSLATGDDGVVGVYVKIDRDAFGEEKEIEYSFGQAISKGFSFGYWTLHDYVAQFKYIFTKKGASQLGGFGTITSLYPSTWDWEGFWYTTALISIILAFMNILPIPALDGGHVMFLLYEIIAGRKPSDKFMEYAQMTGFFILIALLLYANGNDLYRWLFDK
ncbi:RIP metalloprotease RseP [Leptobacterium flavescens]|uniref:Zinc metalloprotease n=1 Tax=Leptobacterium flavescens TaxID=472055 RepID=A0A6P0UMH5_9FLAO|nr:RIP metalloprotease RseP [Leptobacterium flavescens]NER13049.1 RIP metalloprotease RseP [Leptobacterium flavescens]